MIDRAVLAAVDALPDEFREAIVLKDVHDFSCAEIARLLGVAEGTVKSRLHRGRRIPREAACGLMRWRSGSSRGRVKRSA